VYYIFSILAGVLIAIMVVLNGGLTSHYGVYEATVIIHFIGLIFVSILLAAKHEIALPNKKLPFYLYLGGAVGVATIVFNNVAFGKISVSAILALCLLGQCISSLMIDQFGLFGMQKSCFPKNKLTGIVFVVLGIMIMVSLFEVEMLIPIVLSLASGFTVVLSRTISARLAQETTILKSTFYNFFIGLVISCIIIVAVGGYGQLSSKILISSNIWIYLGGIIGVFVVLFSNAIVTKISSFYMTLLLFIGQVFAGLILDILLTHSFTPRNLIGGIFVATGLALIMWVDKRNMFSA